MKKVLVGYVSRAGHTEKMAEFIAEGIRFSGNTVELKKVAQVNDETDLAGYDGYVFGCPTYHKDITGGMHPRPLKGVLPDNPLSSDVGIIDYPVCLVLVDQRHMFCIAYGCIHVEQPLVEVFFFTATTGPVKAPTITQNNLSAEQNPGIGLVVMPGNNQCITGIIALADALGIDDRLLQPVHHHGIVSFRSFEELPV